MIPCPSCGVQNSQLSRWCVQCGIHLADPRIGRLAPPIRRLFANVVDFSVPFGGFVFLFLLLFGTGAAIEGSEPGAFSSFLGFVGSILMLLVVGGAFAYVVWALVLFGSRGMTPGKRFLNIRVIQDDGRIPPFFVMLVREWIAKWVSSLCFGMGFFWILFDRDKQGWHDKLVSTYVVEASEANQGSTNAPGSPSLRGQAGALAGNTPTLGGGSGPAASTASSAATTERE